MSAAKVRAAILLDALRACTKLGEFWTCGQIFEARDKAAWPDAARRLERDYAGLFKPDGVGELYSFWLDSQDWTEGGALNQEEASNAEREWRLTALAFAAAMAETGDL